MLNDLQKMCQMKLNEQKTVKNNHELEPITFGTKEMSELLGVSEATVRTIVKNEQIPTIPYTKNIRVMKTAFYAWCETKGYTLN